jgi:hypothetical protein
VAATSPSRSSGRAMPIYIKFAEVVELFSRVDSRGSGSEEKISIPLITDVTIVLHNVSKKITEGSFMRSMAEYLCMHFFLAPGWEARMLCERSERLAPP